MATVSKTQGTTLLGLQQLSSNSVVVGTAQDVSTKLAATVFIHFALVDAGGVLLDGVEFRIEASAKSSGNDQWFPLVAFKTYTAAPEAEAVSGTVSAAATTIAVSSTTNLSVGNIIFIKNATIANSEWARISGVTTNASITVIDGLTNAQTGSTIYNLAEMYTAQLDLTAIGRIRLVADGSGTGRATVIQGLMTTGDSIS